MPLSGRCVWSVSRGCENQVALAGPARGTVWGPSDSVLAKADPVERARCLLVAAAVPVWSARAGGDGCGPEWNVFYDALLTFFLLIIFLSHL